MPSAVPCCFLIAVEKFLLMYRWIGNSFAPSLSKRASTGDRDEQSGPGRLVLLEQHPWRLAWCLGAALAAACGIPSDRASAIAGDKEQRECRWADSTPVVSIGGADGIGPYALHRVMGTTRLGDGSIAVLNADPPELRFFDAAGRHLGTASRRGTGPGELSQPYRLIRARNDSLLVLDGATQRATFFDRDGRAGRTIALDHGSATPFSVLSDGSILASATRPYERATGLVRTEYVIWRLTESGARHRSLASTPGSEIVFVDAVGSVIGFPRPFGRESQMAAGPSGIYIGDNAEYRITLISREGHVVRSFGRQLSREMPTNEDLERIRTAAAPSGPEGTRLAEAVATVYDRAWTPHFLPVFSRLLIDHREWLWVRRYRPDPADSQMWDVFDTQGRYLCSQVLPARFRVDEIGPDWVLGVSRDSLDVEGVRVLALRRQT